LSARYQVLPAAHRGCLDRKRLENILGDDVST
jgi:hypothetical protein